MVRTLIVAIAFSISPVAADDLGLPVFKGASKKYFNNHEGCVLSATINPPPGKEWDCFTTADELVVGDVSETQLTYWLWVIGANGHQCNMTGDARRVALGRYEYREQNCRLSLQLTSNGVQIEDIGGYCTIAHCGSRAGIGKVEFKADRRK